MTTLAVNVEMKIARPPQEVFEAIVDPEKMAGYFISSGSGRLETGKQVVWRWEDVGAELTVTARAVDSPSAIAFAWSATGIETEVELALEADGGSAGTLVRARERGWSNDDQGLARYAQQIQGWTHMLTCLKAYLEHGINLRV